MKKEYAVGVKDSKDLAGLEYDLKNNTSLENIPNNKVTVVNPRTASHYVTHFLLTEQEAKNLQKDSRVRFVEDLSEEPHIEPDGIQTGTFTRNIFNSANTDEVNYGLQRCNMERNYFRGGSSIVSPPEGLVANKYTYGLDGTGVDVVIFDDGIQVDHPEFNDANGNSRVQQIDWGLYNSNLVLPSDYYTTNLGHGTPVASIAAGLKHGWAKNAHIYSARYWKVGIYDLADAVLTWHRNKTSPGHAEYTGRPTVLVASFSIGSTVVKQVSDIFEMVKEGTRTDIYYETAQRKRELLKLPEGQDEFTVNPPNDTLDAAFEELINAGVHIFKSSGNHEGRNVPSDHPEADDFIVYGNYLQIDDDDDNENDGGEVVYHLRPRSPHSPRAVTVGNVTTVGTFDASEDIGGNRGGSDEFREVCCVGPVVDIFAPGAGTIAAIARHKHTYSTRQWEANSVYHQAVFAGTSASTPQVAGVAALHLQVNPNLTPEELKEKIIDDAKPVMIDDVGDTDELGPFELAGAANKFLFNRYNKMSLISEGTFTGPIKGLSIETS